MTHSSRIQRLLSGQPPELARAIAASRMVFRIAHLMEARIDQALAPFGLQMREYLALILIADHAIEPLRPSDLSVTLDATRTQITRLLDQLEKKELVHRQPGREDRRSSQLALTDAARTLIHQAGPHVHAVYTGSWESVGTDGTKMALDELGKVHQALQDLDVPR